MVEVYKVTMNRVAGKAGDFDSPFYLFCWLAYLFIIIFSDLIIEFISC